MSANDTLWVDLDNTQINWIGRKVTGEHSGNLDLSDGWIIIENGSLKAGQLIFDMNSITNTDIESPEWKLKLENHLKNDDFFAVDSFPHSMLHINGSEVFTKQKSVNNHKIIAKLTIRGITEDISFPILLRESNSIFYAEGNVDINRTLFNIRYKSGEFFPDLGDKIIYDLFSVQFFIQTIVNKKN